MNQTFPPGRSALFGAAALALCCALVSCGGDDDDGASSSVAGGRDVALNAARRIEPLDTAAKSTLAKAQPAARAALDAAAPVASITLPALAAAKAALEAPRKGQPQRIGAVRNVGPQTSADEVARLLQWQALPGGAQAAALRLVSPGAAGVRLGADVQQLPDGALLRFYGDDGEEEVLEVSAAEAARLRAMNEEAGLSEEEARLVWSQVISGSAATLEVELPAGSQPEALALAVPQLSHLLLTPQQAITKAAAESCNLNATCVMDDISTESRAVARMVFNKEDGSFLCTGTLLNDARSSRTPWFITAHHCIKKQEDASTLTTSWFYRAASCASSRSTYSGARQLAGGATLHKTDATYDTSLLTLRNPPPVGVVYAGSYYGDALDTGVGVLGVHHPQGDLQKYSVGAITGYASCDGDACTLDGNSARALWHVRWSRGTTEGGSSGSGLFVRDSASGTRYLAGVLHGGDASCSNRDGFDLYGRFDKAFDAGFGALLK